MTSQNQVTPFQRLFAINGIWLYPPDGYQEEPVPVVGYTLSGEPMRQGWSTFTFPRGFPRQKHLSALMGTDNPDEPKVRLRFICNESGTPRRPDAGVARSTLQP